LRALALALPAAVAVAAVAGCLSAGCETVDLGDPPADINACRPSQQFFLDQIWDNFLDKDYGGKRCHDSGCHDALAGNQLTIPPPSVPKALPLEGPWADVYRSATEQMHCTNVRGSDLLTRPAGLVTHGGGKLIEPNGEEATLIEMWVTAP
jgi:hypothetical protein